MSITTAEVAAKAVASAGRRASRRARVSPGTVGLLLAPYTLFLVAFGAVPIVVAILSSFGFFGGRDGVGLASVDRALRNINLIPAVANVASFLVVFLPVLLVMATGVALIIDSRHDVFGRVMRFVYYLPGVVVGAPLVLLWIFMLAPQLSPFAPLLNVFGAHTLADVLSPGSFPIVFAIMGIFSGVGGWIVVLGGSLAAIDDSILEAAKLDGASAWQTALHVKLPLIRKYVAFIGVISFAGAAQLVVEPGLIATAAAGSISKTWSLNQLAVYFAFKQGDVAVASVYALLLIVIGVAAAVFLVFGLRSYSAELEK
jgi:multiple sugar transport system permease protein